MAPDNFDGSLEVWQSEEASALLVDPSTGLRQLIVGYNDGGGTLGPTGTLFDNKNLMGYAVSRDGGSTWLNSRVSVLVGTGEFVQSVLGDPWLASNASHAHVYFMNMARVSRTSGAHDGVVLATNGDGPFALNWTPALQPDVGVTNAFGNDVSYVSLGQGIDKPSLAVAPNAAEDLYLAYSCPNPSDNPYCETRFRHLNLTRIEHDASSTTLVELGFDESDFVQNPIVATDPQEPDSVFVAYETHPDAATNPFRVMFAKSLDRGQTFPPSFRFELTETLAQPDQTIRVTPRSDDTTACNDAMPCAFAGHSCVIADGTNMGRCTPNARRLRNGIHMDYFAADDGWHYVVWEDDGRIFLRSAFASQGSDGLFFQPIQAVSLLQTKVHPRDFQPTVAAQGPHVAIVYYHQRRTTPDTQVWVAFSDDHGQTFSYEILTRDEAGAAFSFEPCALRRVLPLPGLREDRSGLYGDYIDVLPLSFGTEPYAGFLGSWTDSRLPAGATGGTCDIQNANNAVHQHVYTGVFR